MANGIVLNIDTTKSEFQNPMVQLRQGDGNYQSLAVTVTSNGEPLNLTGWKVTFMGTTAGGFKIVDSAVTITNALQGEFTYTPTKAWGQDQGEFKNAYFKFTKADETASGASFRVNVLEAVDLTAEEAGNYISVVDQLINDVKDNIDGKLAETNQKLTDTEKSVDESKQSALELSDEFSEIKAKSSELENNISEYYSSNIEKELNNSAEATQSFNNLNIDYIQKIQAGNTDKQNVWISHVTGYTYVVGHVNTPEDTVIFEVNNSGTVISSMLIKSDGTNSIHGQNVVFDTENENAYPRFYEWYVDSKIRVQDYVPNTTINYMDMKVAVDVPNTTIGHSFGIDFKNNIFSFWNGTLDSDAKNYKIDVYSFKIDSLNSDGSFSLNENKYFSKGSVSFEYTTDSNPYIVQGVVSVPKSAITKRVSDQNKTIALVFIGSATNYSVPETKDYPYEILVFDTNFGENVNYVGKIDNLKNIFRPSTSQIDFPYKWGVNITNDGDYMEMVEMEAGNVIKTRKGNYSFTFIMLASKGSESMECFLFGSVDLSDIERIHYVETSSSLTKSKRIEPTETFLSNVQDPGTYDIPASKFNTVFVDKPQIFSGKDINMINGTTSYYSGIRLDVSRQNVRGTIIQKLSIFPASSGPVSFERILTPAYKKYGSDNKKLNFVSPWQYIVTSYEARNAGHLLPIALSLTSNTFNVKGMGSYINTDYASKLDSELATLTGTMPGWFENSPIGSNKASDFYESFIQSYTTYDSVKGPSLYKRSVRVTVVGKDDVYTSGYGGGATFNSASPWVKI